MLLHCPCVARPLRAHNNRSETSHGFALVVALSLMALILLLVLSMTTLIEVETRSAQIQLQTLRTRESARLALIMAMGQLQKHAGNDRRATARAEIMGEDTIHPNARFWTGVWNTENMTAAPVWLVSGNNVAASVALTESMQIVGPGTVGENVSQHVYIPTIEVLNKQGNVSNKLGWWISDEGVKASVASPTLHEKPTTDISNKDNALQLQLATTHGLKAIFDQYDRFSASSAKMLDHVSSIKQLNTLEGFSESMPDNSREALFHTLTLNSYGVLASTTKGGLMQDLSLFPGLLGSGLQNYLQLGEAHATQLEALAEPVAKKLLFTNIVGSEELGTLKNGDIATPITPVLSNFMIAFTIRSKEDPAPSDNFLLRARFFCEFWNPYTHTLSMIDSDGNPIDLELEITGFPQIAVQGTASRSAPINLQTIMADPENKENAVIIRLVNNPEKPWLPGRSKNWVGLETTTDPIHSPYQSIDTQTKLWTRNNRTLGGVDGIDTGEPRFGEEIYNISSEPHTIRIKVYKVADGDRVLLSDLNGFLYEPVNTSSHKQIDSHAIMTFGYHVILREPYHSSDESEFYRGRWLKDHDPRSPMPVFRNNWHLANDIENNTGSPYMASFDGKIALSVPEPHWIHQHGNTTINAVKPERLLDRSKGTGISLDDLWQDAPLFELPRKRILSLASLQHIYMHNERPFQVGNSWGSKGRHNTSAWFDRYYFSGLSRDDHPSDFTLHKGPFNPCLRFVDIDSLRTRFPLWREDVTDNSIASREPARNFMVTNRFNINSTSVDAWKAVLSSLRIHNFNYLNWPEEDTSDLDTLGLSQASRKQGSFTRFSHSLEETYQAPPSPDTDNIAPSAFYRHGARRFDDHQFEALAQEIVHLIKEKGTPFESMEAFLSELSPGKGSLLEQAIETVFADPISKRQQWYHEWETTGQDNRENATPIDIDHFAPGFLTQADVMTAIGPMLAPRSDTFKIRARSECYNDYGEYIGSATIEATLQRVPQIIDTTISVDTSADRKWKITSIRWLQNDEI